jgi:two-component system, NarL family, nitrate/nitrite response regulator NarL
MRRVLIVDDHPLVAIGLQLALRARGWEVETTAGPTAETIVATARSFGPDCVLLDLNLGLAGSGLDLVAPLKETGAAVVMLTGETDMLALASCVEAGAEGWIGKHAFLDDIVTSINDVLDGRPLLGRTTRETLLEELRLQRSSLQRARSPFERLTSREELVLAALVEGLSAEQIAEEHFVALTTIRSQIRSILQKLGVRSQLAAVALANRTGWTAPVGESVAAVA